MSIKQALAEYSDLVKGKLGDNFSIFAEDMERVKNSGLTGRALKVGDRAPDFKLPDAFGNQVSSKELLAAGPLVISFYRGEWCPFCNIELRGLQEALPKMKEAGAKLIAISPEKPDGGIIAIEKNQLTYPVLSDSGNAVAKQFGIVFQVGEKLVEFSKNVFKNDLASKNADGSCELPVPATFVIDTNGVIVFAHVDVDYMTGRVEPEEILSALKSLSMVSAK